MQQMMEKIKYYVSNSSENLRENLWSTEESLFENKVEVESKWSVLIRFYC